MVAPRENQTQLEGTIVERSPHPTLDGYDVVRLRVASKSPVEGKADLVHADPGGEIPVVVRRELLGDAAPGARLRFRGALTAAGEIMAEPHPEDPSTFSVEQS